MLCLDAAARARGVVAASAGNHALGLAFHGAQLGVRVTVVMPESAPEVKVSRCRGLGAEVVLHGESFDAAQAHARELAGALGATLVHPFDDPNVIAGQGTMALEILEQVPDVDVLVVPVGGGGLLAGVATVVKTLRPRVRWWRSSRRRRRVSAQPFERGAPTEIALGPTLATALAVRRIGANTFAIAAPRVDESVTVTEDELAAAIALLARRCGVVVEGAGAAPLAAVLARRVRGRCAVLPVAAATSTPTCMLRCSPRSPSSRAARFRARRERSSESARLASCTADGGGASSAAGRRSPARYVRAARPRSPARK